MGRAEKAGTIPRRRRIHTTYSPAAERGRSRHAHRAEPRSVCTSGTVIHRQAPGTAESLPRCTRKSSRGLCQLGEGERRRTAHMRWGGPLPGGLRAQDRLRPAGTRSAPAARCGARLAGPKGAERKGSGLPLRSFAREPTSTVPQADIARVTIVSAGESGSLCRAVLSDPSVPRLLLRTRSVPCAGDGPRARGAGMGIIIAGATMADEKRRQRNRAGSGSRGGGTTRAAAAAATAGRTARTATR